MKKYTYSIFKVSVLLLFLLLGLYLRIRIPYDTLTANTVAFYYSRAEYLENKGSYIKYDDKTFADYKYKENYPPFPAYITVPIYKIVKPFGIDFKRFIAYFPVLIYLVTFFAGFLVMKNLYSQEAGLIFSIILSVTPVAIRSTTKTYYTEEALGMLLIILSLYYIIKSKKFDYNFFLAAIFLTMLSLTWQVFLLVQSMVGILFILSIRNKKLSMMYGALALAPFVIGHILSVYIIGLDYSPIHIVNESLITLRDSDKELFKIAFSRLDLGTPGALHIFNEFGYLISFLILIGFLHLLFNFKEQKNKALLIIGIIAAVAFLTSSKFRYFAFASLGLIAALGAYSLINYNSMKKNQKIALFSIVALLGIFWFLTKINVPKCEVTIDSPLGIEPNKYYPVTFIVKNTGSDPLCDNFTDQRHAFGGIHMEIANVTIINKSSSVQTDNVSLKYRVPILEISWFEAKFDCLKSGETATVTAWVLPHDDKIQVSYRCWFPKRICNRESPLGMRSKYEAEWRDEKCMVRYPNKGELCDAKVFAGYFNKKDFYCYKTEINYTRRQK